MRVYSCLGHLQTCLGADIAPPEVPEPRGLHGISGTSGGAMSASLQAWGSFRQLWTRILIVFLARLAVQQLLDVVFVHGLTACPTPREAIGARAPLTAPRRPRCKPVDDQGSCRRAFRCTLTRARSAHSPRSASSCMIGAMWRRSPLRSERAAVGAFSVSCLLQRRMLFRSYSALSQAFRQALGGLETFRNVEMDSDNFHRSPESNAKRRRSRSICKSMQENKGSPSSSRETSLSHRSCNRVPECAQNTAGVSRAAPPPDFSTSTEEHRTSQRIVCETSNR